MAHPLDLRELLEARDGRPTEEQAARKIATFAVIPAAMIGLFAGTRLVGLADPMERLLWVCTAIATLASFGVAFLVLGLYYAFGFRPVAVLADALVGGLTGFLGGGTLTLLLMSLKLVHPNLALWGLLLSPLGAVAVPLYRSWSGASRVRRAVGRDAESPTPETRGEPQPPVMPD